MTREIGTGISIRVARPNRDITPHRYCDRICTVFIPRDLIFFHTTEMETIKQSWRELKDVICRPRHVSYRLSYQYVLTDFRFSSPLIPSFLQFAQQLVNLGCVVFSALMLWKILVLATGSQSPIVVVLRYISRILSV